MDELNADQIEAEMSMLAKQEAELESQRLLQQQKNKLLAMRACTAELKDEIANEKDRETHIKSSHNHMRVHNVVRVDMGELPVAILESNFQHQQQLVMYKQ